MHQFDRDVLVTPLRSKCYSRPVTANWSINGVPNGGYLLAIMANAMLQHNQKATTAILTANYLNRCEPGDATVLVDKMSTSRQFDRSQATLIQNGEEKIRAFGTFAIEKIEGLLDSCEDKSLEITELENCVPVPAMPNYTLFDQLDVILDPISAGWLSGNLSDRSESKGWIRFKNERPFDFLSILLIADSFPPAVLSTQGPAWVPSLEFSVNIRSIPKTKLLKCLFRTRFITCGMLEEDGEIWDQNGELVAISRQIAQYRAPK